MNLMERIAQQARSYIETHSIEMDTLDEGVLTNVYGGVMWDNGARWVAVMETGEGRIYYFLASDYDKLLAVDMAQ